jgi:hypothetical protein
VNTRTPLRLAAARLRLLAILAGIAWLMGLHPGASVRLLVVAIVVDALATPTGPAASRTVLPRVLAKGARR